MLSKVTIRGVSLEHSTFISDITAVLKQIDESILFHIYSTKTYVNVYKNVYKSSKLKVLVKLLTKVICV